MPESFSFMQGSPLYSSGRLSFSRPVPTADPLGARISENTPRFGYSAAIAGLLPQPEVIDDSLSAGSVLMHVGLDKDGATPLAAIYQPASRTLKIYRESNGINPRLKPLRAISLPTDAGIGAGDLLSTISNGCPVGSLCFDPNTMLIVHGTIVVLCRVSRKIAAGNWQVQGVGIVYSTNLGKSWTKYWSDIDDPRNLGRGRLAGWEMTNYYTPYQHGGKPPLEVVIPFSDYRLGGTPNPSTGGRIGWFKMVRSSLADAFEPLWGPGGAQAGDHRMACFTLDTNPADNRYCHVHAVGVAEFTPQGQKPGWQLIAGIGDGAASSMLRIIVKDTSQYWLPTLSGNIKNWTIQANFHGRADSALLRDNPVGPGDGEHQNFDNATGMQFVGCGPGPTPGTLILGSDAVGEGLMVLDPGNEISSKPRIQSVASAFGSISKSNCFFTRVDRPELPVRTVTCGMKMSPYNSGRPVFGNIDCIWYSRNNGAPGTWAAVTYAGIDERYSLLNGYIYALTIGGFQFIRIPLPPVRIGRPLLIGPGGNQWLRDDPTRLNVSGLQVIRCPRDVQGQWLYPSADGLSTLGVINPQPPVMVDAVFRIRKKIEDASGGMMLTVSGSQTHPRAGSQLLEHARIEAWPEDPPPDPARPMWLRAFIRNTPSDLDLSSFEAGRNPTSFDLATAFEGVPRALSDMYLVAQDRWQAVVSSLESPVGSGEWFSYICRNRAKSSDTDGLIAFSEFLSDTYRGPGYPLPPDQPECIPEPPPDFPGWGCLPMPTQFPDELAQISNLGLSGAWTLLLAGLCPDDSWDQFTVQDPLDQQHVLFSLLSQSSATLCLRAITRSDPLNQPGLALCYQLAPSANELRKVISGISFFRNRPILLALTGHAASTRLTLTAALGGDLLPKLSITTPVVGSAFDTLTFSGPQGQGSVSAFQWIGCKTESRVLSDAEILAQFQTLNFIPS